MARVGCIGLGTMGGPMAGHLLDAGHEVAVWNRTAAKGDELVARGARRADSPADAARDADVVVTCVSDTPDLVAVVLGDHGVIEGIRDGAVLLDCSTVSPSAEKELAEALAGKSVEVVDAPLSGGAEGAKNGVCTAFVGGSETAYASAKPILEAFCKTITHLGPTGAGQAAKAVNQIIISGTYASVGEGLAYAEQAGLPMEALVEALSGGAAGSWILTTRSPKYISHEYPAGFRTVLHRKDLGIAIEEGEAVGLELRLTRLVAEWQDALIAAGYGEEDSSALGRIGRGDVTP
ncbi:MAG: NAD(P)-dependent oxidoreductase [Thermoleophilia bacterium]|jgi:3-hydroxyisobutyrate dehydrogenase-like beta-hydroxyacid dehydrogenase|nr:NAD(P)-dependent oxidoreductase [Thermoleophilia bacterium]